LQRTIDAAYDMPPSGWAIKRTRMIHNIADFTSHRMAANSAARSVQLIAAVGFEHERGPRQ
jgi:hypothetical protein